MPPKVSVLICVYNGERYLPAAIGSVLRQTFEDFELLIWDDGSTDASAEVAERAAGGDRRVRIIRAGHTNLCRSINAGAKSLAGRYFATVDSDDALAPTALEETVAFLEAPQNADVAMVYTDHMTMDEAGRVKGVSNRSKVPYSKERLLLDFMTFHLRLMRRAAFDRVGGFDETMDAGGDYDFCLRLSEVAEIRHLSRPLYFYRLHRNSVSTSRRLDQIMRSKEAIARALVRRGMAEEFEVDVELIGRFRLRRKSET